VWTVWCKTTRRVYLFNDADWSWPIWVWDDPYKLDTFFPFFPLSFYTDPEGGETKGETTYYLDQQDAINEMLSEQRLARACARRHIVYNSNLITQEGAERILKGADGTVVGVDLPDGVKITDVVFSVPPPAVQFGQLFDPTQKYAAIDRISPVSDVMRGAQYKTNTTNQAIEQYNRTGSIRLDERQDALENFLSSVFWGIAQLCLQFMDKETVMSVIGKKGANWQNLTSTEISRKFSVSVVSGSTAKPTSEKKKREAIEIAQILGQFANATPVAAIVALKVFARAFDEIIISEDDWKTIKQALEQSITQGNNAHKGGEDQISQIEQMIDSLPPQAKQAIGQALAQGAPIRAILEQVMARVGNQQQQQTGVENE
jgi:hypothetical protein